MSEARAGLLSREKGRISIFGLSRKGSTALPNNDVTTSLDDLDVELILGLCDIVGYRASIGDVWACDIASGSQ